MDRPSIPFSNLPHSSRRAFLDSRQVPHNHTTFHKRRDKTTNNNQSLRTGNGLLAVPIGGHSQNLRSAIAEFYRLSQRQIRQSARKDRIRTFKLSRDEASLFYKASDKLRGGKQQTKIKVSYHRGTLTITMASWYHEMSTREFADFCRDTYSYLLTSEFSGRQGPTQLRLKECGQPRLTKEYLARNQHSDTNSTVDPRRTIGAVPDTGFYTGNHEICYGRLYPPVVFETAVSQSLSSLTKKLVEWVCCCMGRVCMAVGLYCPPYKLDKTKPAIAPPLRLLVYGKVDINDTRTKFPVACLCDEWIINPEGEVQTGHYDFPVKYFTYVQEAKRNAIGYKEVPTGLNEATMRFCFETFAENVKDRIKSSKAFNQGSVASSGGNDQSGYLEGAEPPVHPDDRQNTDSDYSQMEEDVSASVSMDCKVHDSDYVPSSGSAASDTSMVSHLSDGDYVILRPYDRSDSPAMTASASSPDHRNSTDKAENRPTSPDELAMDISPPRLPRQRVSRHKAPRQTSRGGNDDDEEYHPSSDSSKADTSMETVSADGNLLDEIEGPVRGQPLASCLRFQKHQRQPSSVVPDEDTRASTDEDGRGSDGGYHADHEVYKSDSSFSLSDDVDEKPDQEYDDYTTSPEITRAVLDNFRAQVDTLVASAIKRGIADSDVGNGPGQAITEEETIEYLHEIAGFF
ncbi:hypothetical protein BJ508DRAFT_336684 [Ascobolus immersus RN42]|uniref:Uncharacterized protein n=1 Tax=Ascobolus immersus RN42 TaxID=1160509 RepID=A0A3N4HBW4_ASCIM|nr:hypothetical protein BJ508DRAFT_336684 [Ascobolus immersus RN42]